MAQENEFLVRVSNVTKEYSFGKQTLLALRNASLLVLKGEFLALAGPSGSGKSTMLNLIGCIDTPTSGNISIDGQKISHQSPDQLAEGKQQRHERVSRFLELVGVERFARHRPNQLSGGQRQRVAIARALVVEPSIVLADEPTANLDHRTGEGILQLMQRINRESGTTFIFSTHDPRVMEMAGRVIRLEDGEIVDG
jgi:putative ABC transport system ATP-binding protein